jgi:hypothetical protein
MICPHDHQECDNRGCRYGGCQGRTTGELVAHKDPRFRKNISVKSRNGGTASAPIADRPAVSGSSAEFRHFGSPLSLLRPSLGLILD